MSRVFLVSTNTTVTPYAVYPLGMSTVAAALRKGGHEVRQFDYLAAGKDKERLRKELERFRPDCVGFSMRNIDTCDSFTAETVWYLETARELVAAVRGWTSAPIILGGPAYSLMPEEILDFVGADHGIVGEGEELIIELLDTLEKGEGAPKVLRGNGKLLGGDDIGGPLMDEDLMKYYARESDIINIQSKRGCPYNCLYCSYPLLEGRRFRIRSAEAVVDDMESAHRLSGVSSFFFTDSIFNDRGGNYLAVAEELVRRDLGLKWSAIFRPRRIGREELRLLKRAGLYAMEFGTDASSDETLGGLNKGFDFGEVLEFNRRCLSEGIPCAHYIMFGGPGETPGTVSEGLRNIEKLDRNIVFAFYGLRILPGTSLMDLAIREGRLGSREELLRPKYYFSPHLEDGAVEEAIKMSFRGRRDRVFPPPEGEIRMQVMRRFGFRGLLWEKLFRHEERKEKSKAGRESGRNGQE